MVEKRSYGFAFTWYNHTYEQFFEFLGENFDYFIAGYEVCPTTNREHLQCYVHFPNKRSESNVRKLLPGTHFEPERGTPKQNQQYCLGNYPGKELNTHVLEFGECPQQGRASFDKIVDAMQYPETNFGLYAQYKKSYQEYQLTLPVVPKERNVCLVSKLNLHAELEHIPKHWICMPGVPYDGEPYHVLENVIWDVYDNVKLWAWGYAPKYKYGYQLRRYDPDVVIIVYTTQTEFIEFKDKFHNMYIENI